MSSIVCSTELVKPFAQLFRLLRIGKIKWLSGILGFISLYGMGMEKVYSMPWPEQDLRCIEVSKKQKLPVKLKTRGKPKRARWEQVDRVLTDIGEDIKQVSCQFSFDSMFKTKEKELYIPLTNNVIRMVKDEVLRGLSVFYQSGEAVGKYVSRVTYERSGGLYVKDSYTLYSFRFRNADGQVIVVGHDLLLDTFVIRWSDIHNRIALSSQGEVLK